MTPRPNDPTALWPVRMPMALGFAALFVLIGGFGGWAGLTTLAGAVVAHGQIEVDRNRQAIQHPDGGVVADVLVGEGDRVALGQVLMRLDSADLVAEQAVAQAQLFELGVRRARLEAERDRAHTLRFLPELRRAAAETPPWAELMQGQRDLFWARNMVQARETDQLNNRITQIGAQIAALSAQEMALNEQLTLVEADLQRQRDMLARGLAENGPILRLQRDAAQMRGSLGAIEAQKYEAAERVVEAELQIIQLGNARVEAAISELRDLRVEEEALRAHVAELARRIDRLELRAPVAGTLHGLALFGPQSVLRAADPVAYLVPDGRPLIITARVPAIHVDQIFLGQPVILRFPAFDLRHIPNLMGQLTQISADVFVEEGTGARFYRAEIVIDEDEIARLEHRRLVPGMPVEAFIRTEDRSPFSYLVAPLAAYFNRAFREN